MTACTAHHYVFNTPDGSPTVTGVCKHCGAVQTCPIWQESYEKLRTTVVDKVSAKW